MVDPTLADDRLAGIESGTLNLVLANKNGFVIATDSKATGNGGPPRYDSQKLFRTGPKTAVAVAGLAAVNLPDPFQFEIAALVRSYFGPNGLSDGRGALGSVDFWLTSDVGAELNRLFSLFSADGYRAEPFVATLVGFNDQSIPEIRVIDFVPARRALGLHGELFPQYETREDTLTAKSFRVVTVGVDTVARKILAGELPTENESVHSYVRRLDQGGLDEMPLPEMKSLAIAIFDATKRDPQASQVVGGDTQIAVFPTTGKEEWVQQAFPPRQPLFTRTNLTIGASLSPQSKSIVEAGGAVEMVYQFGGPLTAFKSIYVANEFRDEQVILNGNAFAGNVFRHCKLKSLAGSLFYTNNRCLDSVLEVPIDNTVRDVALTDKCEPPGSRPE
ncbi:MAG TPA: hypothetical protein VG206_15740 [Terriglobia bacterium]|nr:hypothetical protein [Terriglobia bacterium]